MSTWTKILCAVDFSESSRRALEVAAGLSRALHCELAVIYVESDGDVPAMPSEEGSEGSEAVSASWRADAEQLAGSSTRLVLARGDPATEILRIADEGNYDAIVLAPLGRGLAHALLGSVADKVARQATCSVVFARATPWRGD